MQIDLLQDIVVIFALSILVSVLFHKIKIPAIVGFLITGIAAGPYALKLVSHTHEIEILAEIGVILLLFTIGIEFSLKSLVKIKRTVFLGGGLQVGLTILFSYILLSFFEIPVNQSIFFGFLIALSSTAVVLKVIQERAEVNTHHGRTSLAILIFQDLIIVPMILFTPMLAGKGGNVGQEMLIMLAKAIGLVLFMIVASRYVIPKIFHYVARTQSQELFLFTVLVIGFSVAWLTSELGLSLALGAFLAGLAISESEYSHQAFGNIMPFRDIFSSFFFVSIGMLLNLDYLFSNLLLILGLTIGIILIKTFINGSVAFVLGYPLGTTVVIGLVLSQIGEFSFILAKIGVDNGLMNHEYYQAFLSVTVLTIALTPFIIMIAPVVNKKISKMNLPAFMLQGLRKIPETKIEHIKHHLILVGNGHIIDQLIRSAKSAGISFLVIDNDPDQVRELQIEGQNAIFGDAAHANVLEHAHIADAEVLVVAVDQPAAEFSITKEARKLNPMLHIIVRTRFIEDVDDLYTLGANEVIPEEYETAITVFARVMNKFLIPRDEIDQLLYEHRAHAYGLYRQSDQRVNIENKLKGQEIHLPNIEITSLRISPSSKLANQRLIDIQLRKKYGLTILAIQRGGKIYNTPPSDTILLPEDIAVIIGEPEKIACATILFREAFKPASDTN